MVLTLETSRVCNIGPDLSVNLNQTLIDNRSNLPSRQGVLQPVAEEDGEREGFTEFVGTRGWARSLERTLNP